MPNNDYILRSDALEHFGNYLPGYSIQKDDVIQGIKELPAADVEPVRHGRWIPINRINPAWSQFGIAQHKCSECGSEEVTARKRCPECGAKMDGEVNNGTA
jgi:hypothetical protein